MVTLIKRILGWLSLLLILGSAVPAWAAEPATATFAGGCFWCMEKPFDELPGVLETTSGYTGGTVTDPSYEQVSAGGTGHVEAVQVRYDPAQISYEQLLAVFWQNVDPLDDKGQFCDRGSQYRSIIFYHTPAQEQQAAQSKQALAASQPFDAEVIATEIRPALPFYAAEDYHQDYYQNHPLLYKVYRFSCGRDRRLEALWGDAEAPLHSPATESGQS